MNTIPVPWKPGGTVLEVGGGDTPSFRPNMDMRALPTVDIVCDLEKTWTIPNESYDGIYGKFVIEHMSWRAVPHFLSECYRVLKPGGGILMIGPNTLEQCKEIARRDIITIVESAMLFGGQEERGWNEHKAAFSSEYIKNLCGEAGFSKMETMPLPGCNTDMITQAWKGERVMQLASLYLNIGSFTVMVGGGGWENCDILDLSAYAQQNGYRFRQFDATKGLPYGDCSVDAIISSHFLEHVTRQQGAAFLKECLRVLKPKGVIRITVPDTKLIARAYTADMVRQRFSFNEGVKNAIDESEAFWNLITANHVTAYDSISLLDALNKAGFCDVDQVATGKSRCAEIQISTTDMYPDHSLYMEGAKHAIPTSASLPTMYNQKHTERTDRKLKIGVISTPFFQVPPKGYSGLERVVWDLACGLSDRGHEVTIFAPEGSEAPPNGHLVVTGPSYNTVNVNWLAIEEAAYKIYEPYLKDLDIVHGNNWFGYEYAAKAKNNNLKCCHTHHGHLNPEWWLKTKPSFKLNFIGLSKFMQREFIQMGMPSEYAWNGIDLNKYKFIEQKGGRLLFVGRLDTFKQPHVAIEIARKLSIGLDIFGGSFVQDANYLEQIKRSCDGSQIIMHLDDTQDEKVRYMQNALCLLFPSKMLEPWGLVAAEAMSCGTPVIAMDDGAISEVVENNVTGYVCKSTEEMCESVSRLGRISHIACRQRVEGLFSRDKMAEKYEELYLRIIRGDEW